MNENTKRLTDPIVLEKIRAIEASPEHHQKLEQIKSDMSGNARKNNLGWLTMVIGAIILYGMVDRSLALFLIIFVGGLVWPRLKTFKTANELSYVDHFLLPVLQEALPDVKIDYYSGIEPSLLKLATPSSRWYDSNCHIIFGDDMQTEFCNLYAYHEENEDDNWHRVTDFNGQVLLAKYHTAIKGYIRIVPTQKGFLGREKVHSGYKAKLKGEVQLEMEDIRFNETYNVYCTDELSARMLLNPYMLAVLDEWREEMPVAVYMNGDTVVVSFYSGQQLLKTPSSRGAIEKLALSSEYENIQDKLVKMYRLLDTLNHQL
ncbi:TPA: DUF3137 domain-containing protein [Streptococcus equi subsp. zooepidemicus]|nr:DUF3137 domain-containing protein [Streptococcus equi subsp. zooepidemicus]